MESLTIESLPSFVKETAAIAATDPHGGISRYEMVLSFLRDANEMSTAIAEQTAAEEERGNVSTYPSFPSDNTASPATGAESSLLRLHEDVIYEVAALYAATQQPNPIEALLHSLRPLFSLLPKARTARIVRTLLSVAARIPNSLASQQTLCESIIAWCIREKRTFLRLRVATRLATIHFECNHLQQGLSMVSKLLKEVKKLDDKLLLVEIHLIESKLQFASLNIARAKAALTAARTSANSIHCPPYLQGEVDMVGGMLHMKERDSRTAFSYFFEALEAFTISASTPTSWTSPTSEAIAKKAAAAFSYMIVAKIVNGQPEEVNALVASKYGLKYSGREDVSALQEISRCYKERSLQMFESTLAKYSNVWEADGFVKQQIEELYETFLEQNLMRVLEPFSKVELHHVAALMQLPVEGVEKKLAEMILDKKLNATLDQGVGVLILFDNKVLPQFYADALSTINNMANAVETLYQKAQ